MRLEEVMSTTEANEIAELGRTAVLDGDDVVPFETMPDTAAGHGAHTVSAGQRRVDVCRYPPTDVCHRRNIDAALDDHLGERASEKVFDNRKRNGADASDLTKFSWLQLTASQRLGAHVQDDLGARSAVNASGAPPRLAERGQSIGEVCVVRLPPPLTPRLRKDVSAQRFEGVTHNRPLDRGELAADRNGALGCRTEAEMPSLTKPGIAGGGLFLRSMRRDD